MTVFLLAAGLAWAGRPLTLDDADPVEPGQAEIEAGAAWDTGFRWNAGGGLTLDFAAGSKLRGGAPDFTGTAGVTWRFGLGPQHPP